MNKEQATQHILTRLRANYSPEEVADELARILKAPPEMARRFVDQVAAKHPEVVAPPQDESPEWLQSLNHLAEEPTQEIPLPVETTTTQHTDNGLPPGLQALINDESAFAQAVEPVPQSDSESVQASTHSQTIENESMPEEAVDISDKNIPEKQVDLDALGEEVFTLLKKQRRQNDIIEMVCNRTGWHWNKSQRFVARVKTQKHDELRSGQSRLTIFIGAVIIIVGLVLTLNSASIISDYAKLAAFARTNPEAILNIDPRALVIAIGSGITGLGMIIGGGYGVGRALTDR